MAQSRVIEIKIKTVLTCDKCSKEYEQVYSKKDYIDPMGYPTKHFPTDWLLVETYHKLPSDETKSYVFIICATVKEMIQ